MSSVLEGALVAPFTQEELDRLIAEFEARGLDSHSKEEIVAYFAGIEFSKRVRGWRKFDASNTEALADGVQYLVKAHSADQRWCEIMTWNAVHQCWDGADGDDYECDTVSMYKYIDLDA